MKEDFDKSEIIAPKRVEPLINECKGLCAIIGKSILTAKKK